MGPLDVVSRDTMETVRWYPRQSAVYELLTGQKPGRGGVLDVILEIKSQPLT